MVYKYTHNTHKSSQLFFSHVRCKSWGSCVHWHASWSIRAALCRPQGLGKMLPAEPLLCHWLGILIQPFVPKCLNGSTHTHKVLEGSRIWPDKSCWVKIKRISKCGNNPILEVFLIPPAIQPLWSRIFCPRLEKISRFHLPDAYSFWDLEQIPLFVFGIAAFWRIVKYSSTCLARIKFTTTFSFHSQNMSKAHTLLLLYRLNMALTHKWWVLALRHQWCCCVFKF